MPARELLSLLAAIPEPDGLWTVAAGNPRYDSPPDEITILTAPADPGSPLPGKGAAEHPTSQVIYVIDTAVIDTLLNAALGPLGGHGPNYDELISIIKIVIQPRMLVVKIVTMTAGTFLRAHGLGLLAPASGRILTRILVAMLDYLLGDSRRDSRLVWFLKWIEIILYAQGHRLQDSPEFRSNLVAWITWLWGGEPRQHKPRSNSQASPGSMPHSTPDPPPESTGPPPGPPPNPPDQPGPGPHPSPTPPAGPRAGYPQPAQAAGRAGSPAPAFARLPEPPEDVARDHTQTAQQARPTSPQTARPASGQPYPRPTSPGRGRAARLDQAPPALPPASQAGPPTETSSERSTGRLETPGDSHSDPETVTPSQRPGRSEPAEESRSKSRARQGYGIRDTHRGRGGRQ